MKNISQETKPKMIIFDHDGTLVCTETPDFSLFPGIKELLVDLVAQDFHISVWTARSHKSTVESLKRLGIAEYVGEIYGHDDGLSKPHPMGLLKITQGIEKENLLHIGDSLGDLDGAKAFGIPVIAACWNSTIQVEIFRAKTPYVAMKPADCRPIIEAHFNLKLG